MWQSQYDVFAFALLHLEKKNCLKCAIKFFFSRQLLLFVILYLLYINFNYCWHIKAVLHILYLVCTVIYILSDECK